MTTKLETFLQQLVVKKRTTGEIEPLVQTPNQRRMLKALIQKMRSHGIRCSLLERDDANHQND